MGDVIDFKSALKRLSAQNENSSLRAGDETVLEYDPKPGSVGVQLTTGADGVARFVVTVPGEDIAKSVEEAQSALLQSFGVDPRDSRSGEALAAVKEQMGDAAFDAFVTTFVQQHFFAIALQRTGVLPFLDPDMPATDAPVPGADYTFEVDTLLRPSLELTSYDPVTVKLPEKKKVSSKDVSEYLANMSEELATWEEDPSRDSVVTGDRVTLNLDASTADGREFKPLTGRHVPYEVGSGVIGDEFDREVLAMKPRERREFSLSVPVPAADGSVDYQVIKIKAQLDTVQKKVPAKIDDGWVLKNLPEAQTLLGLRGRIRTALEREADRAYNEEVMALTAEELSKRLVGDIDPRYVEKMRDELISQFIVDLQRRGGDYAQFMAQPGFDKDAWEAQMTEEAEHALRRGLALDSLADHLDINLDEKDIAEVVTKMAPGQEAEVLQGLLDSGQMPKMCEVALRLRANKWLVEHVKDSSGPKLQLI